MKKALSIIIVAVICFTPSFLFSQKKGLKVEIENISLRAPEHYLVNRTQKKMYGFTVKLYNETNNNQVVVSCIKKAMNQEAAIMEASSERSLKPGYEYMIIEKVKSKPLGKYNAKFVEYTNSPLRDYFRGGYYGIIDNGYTYVVEYYSADTPEDRQEVEKILSSLNILKPESRPNFFEVEKEYLVEDVSVKKPEEHADDSKVKEEDSAKETKIEKSKKESKTQVQEITHETPKAAPIAEIKDEPKQEKKSFWTKITSIFKKKDKR